MRTGNIRITREDDVIFSIWEKCKLKQELEVCLEYGSSGTANFYELYSPEWFNWYYGYNSLEIENEHCGQS